jgi:hypothetical protein
MKIELPLILDEEGKKKTPERLRTEAALSNYGNQRLANGEHKRHK